MIESLAIHGGKPAVSRPLAPFQGIGAEERAAGREVHPETASLESEADLLGLRDRVVAGTKKPLGDSLSSR